MLLFLLCLCMLAGCSNVGAQNAPVETAESNNITESQEKAEIGEKNMRSKIKGVMIVAKIPRERKL